MIICLYECLVEITAYFWKSSSLYWYEHRPLNVSHFFYIRMQSGFYVEHFYEWQETFFLIYMNKQNLFASCLWILTTIFFVHFLKLSFNYIDGGHLCPAGLPYTLPAKYILPCRTPTIPYLPSIFYPVGLPLNPACQVYSTL